jgi:hypothetical protein
MLKPIDINNVRGKRNLKLTMNRETWDVGIRDGNYAEVNGTMRTTKNGEVIEWKSFRNGNLEVAHSDVVVRNCYFTNLQYHTLYQLGGAGNCVVELCTFDGRPNNAVVNASNADFIFAHNRPMTVRQCIFLDASNDSLNSVGGLMEKNVIIGGGFTAGAHADAISVHTTVAKFTASKNYIDYRQREGAVIPNACIKYVSVPSIGQGQGAGNGIAHDVECYDSVCIGGGYTCYLDSTYSKVERNCIDAGYWYGTSDTGDVYPPVPPGYKNNFNMAGLPDDYVSIAAGDGEVITPPDPGDEMAPAPIKGPKEFVLMAWMQPPYTHATWKSRHVTTMYYLPQGTTLAAFDASLQGLGMTFIRQPDANPAADANKPGLIAWSHMDEPTVDPAHVVSPATLAATKSAADSKLPAGVKIPWVLNHVANHILNNDFNMDPYHEHNVCDWTGADVYPPSGAAMLRTQNGYTAPPCSMVLDMQRGFNADLAFYTFLGSSYPCTPGEMRMMIWSSVIHGAMGIAYFPIAFSPSFVFDATPANIATEMTTQHARIRAIESILIDKTNGGIKQGGTLYKCAPTGQTPKADQLPYPFEARKIPTSGGDYLIILNLSPNPATLSYAPLGINGLAFSAHECKTNVTAVQPPVQPPVEPPAGGDWQKQIDATNARIDTLIANLHKV